MRPPAQKVFAFQNRDVYALFRQNRRRRCPGKTATHYHNITPGIVLFSVHRPLSQLVTTLIPRNPGRNRPPILSGVPPRRQRSEKREIE